MQMCKIGIGGTHPSRTNDLSSCFGESYAIRLYFTACVLISWWWVSEICSYNLPNFNDSWRTAYRIMDIMKNNNQLYEQIVTSVFLWSMFRFFLLSVRAIYSNIFTSVVWSLAFPEEVICTVSLSLSLFSVVRSFRQSIFSILLWLIHQPWFDNMSYQRVSYAEYSMFTPPE